MEATRQRRVEELQARTLEILSDGRVYCVGCRASVWPDRDGVCLWCGTTVGEPVAADPSQPAPPESLPGECDYCSAALSGQQTRYCSPVCRKSYWLKFTDAGRVFAKRTNVKQAARKRAQRAAARDAS